MKVTEVGKKGRIIVTGSGWGQGGVADKVAVSVVCDEDLGDIKQ